MNDDTLKAWLTAFYAHQIGSRKMLAWLAKENDVAKVINATPLTAIKLQISEQDQMAFCQVSPSQIDADLNWARLPDHHIIPLAHPAYPALLKEIASPPLLLFVKGEIKALKSTQLAIVGARHATLNGVDHAEKFAFTLATAGLTISSGLALGIDSAAHRGALAARGVTVAVVGTGLSRTYPSSNRSLAAEIIEKGGAVVSELPLNAPPKAEHFPRRNRIIAGMSVGVLVVEAAIKSGSLITARAALNEGREIFAIPGSIHQPLSRGCHHLIQQGAKLVENAQDVLDELSQYTFKSAGKIVENQKDVELLANLSPESVQLLGQIEYEITSLDMILCRSGLTPSEVSSILLTLELKGYIQSAPGGYARLSIENH